MKRLALLLPAMLTLLNGAPTRAQLELEGDLLDRIDAIIDDMPSNYNGGDYLQPNADSRELWREIIDDILDGDYASAHAAAQTKSYQVVLYTDTGTSPAGRHVILERTPGSTSRHWGTYVFNRTPSRPHLVVASPHPVFDLNTGFQGVRMYQFTQARAFLLAGTHRCNGLSYSPCDGSTSVCSGTSDNYRYSDMAHVVKSAFHITHESLFDHDPDLIAIQNHGFAETSSDPDMIISNGTRTTPTGHDYVRALRDAFTFIDPSLTYKIGHLDLSWTRLLGTSNTQGRSINGSGSPCDIAPASATGRFIHIEQAVVRMTSRKQDMMMLAQALAIAVPAGATPVEDMITTEPLVRIVPEFDNPLGRRVQVAFELGRTGTTSLDVYDLAGRRVARLAGGSIPAGVHARVWDTGRLPSGVYFLHLRQGNSRDTRRCVLVR